MATSPSVAVGINADKGQLFSKPFSQQARADMQHIVDLNPEDKKLFEEISL